MQRDSSDAFSGIDRSTGHSPGRSSGPGRSADRGPRVVVIGAGIAGLQTAWNLVREGRAQVTLVEAEERLAVHSSGRNAGILRSLTGHSELDRLSARSLPFFRSPPAAVADSPLVDGRGLLLAADAGAAAEELVAMVERGPRSADASPPEVLDPARLRELVPYSARPAAVLYRYPDEGLIDLQRLIHGLARACTAAGAVLRLGARAVEFETAAGQLTGVRLANGERLPAERVVASPGGWAGQIAARAGSPLRFRPTRRHAAITAPDGAIDAEAPPLWQAGESFYSRPAEGALMVCACDEVEADPDALQPDAIELARLTERAGRHLQLEREPRLARTWVGLRTFAEDEHFVLGEDPIVRGLVWAAGLGGHGISTSPEVGRLAAAAVLGLDEPGLAPFCPRRFTAAEPL